MVLQVDTRVSSVAQVIQLSVAPVFLLSGVGTLLIVLTNRLAGVALCFVAAMAAMIGALLCFLRAILLATSGLRPRRR